MIAYVKGILEYASEDLVIIEVNGFGINVHINPETYSALNPVGEEVKLYTYTCVREDSFSLFGFISMDELEVFKKLISVSGIGPKGGLSILSVMSTDELRFAVASGDSKLIAKAPGIGKKTAERVILELRDKLSVSDTFVSSEINNGLPIKENNGPRNEAIEALCALGYTLQEASVAVKKCQVSDDSDTEQILKEALKYLF